MQESRHIYRNCSVQITRPYFQFITTCLLVFYVALNISIAHAANLNILIDRQAYKADELLVKFKQNTTGVQASSMLSRQGMLSVKQYDIAVSGRNADQAPWHLVKVAPADLRVMKARLAKDPNIDSVEFNHKIYLSAVPNDPLFVNQWNLHNTGQAGGANDADIDAPEAWDLVTEPGRAIVAVVDTGIDTSHPDLIQNLWVNEAEIPANGIDDDGNGYIDDVNGYDFVNREGNPVDENGHGTHVSGIIAAQGNNQIGVSGVSWGARVMALKFLDASGSGNVSDAIEAIQYATKMKARVINASWGSEIHSRALADALQMSGQAGVLVVTAAGNAAINTDEVAFYPASYDFSNIISVAATNMIDNRAIFSNYGLKTVDLGAPGVDIFSTVPLLDPPCCPGETGYAYLSGTSMAAPHVSGAAVLLLTNYPLLTHVQLKERLLLSAEKIADLQGSVLTGGRLNVYNAMEDDSEVPGAVTDLVAEEVGSRSFALQWSGSGDDGQSGSASGYELRYSTQPINAVNFDSAAAADFIAATGPAGAVVTYTLKNLQPGTQYYIALKAQDNVGNKSALSNIISATTKPSAVIFYDDMEQSEAKWQVTGSDGVGGGALWHFTSRKFQSATNAMYYGRESDLTYNTGARNFGEMTSVEIDLSAASDTWLTFAHYLVLEEGVDRASVQVSSNGGASWSDAFVTTTGTPGTTFVQQNVDLSAYDGLVIQLRFSFDTQDELLNGYEGWYVDDVKISATSTKPANSPPIAILSAPAQAVRQQLITFQGTDSMDPDEDKLSYQWDFGDGTVGAGASVQHQYQQLGTYTVTLIVSDGKLSSEPATSTIEIINAPPQAVAGSDQFVGWRQWITLDATGSVDPDGSQMRYYWEQLSGKKVRLLHRNSALAKFYAPRMGCGKAGQLGFRLTVVDGDGASSTDQMNVYVSRDC